jgi:hypothetical protein
VRFASARLCQKLKCYFAYLSFLREKFREKEKYIKKLKITIDILDFSDMLLHELQVNYKYAGVAHEAKCTGNATTLDPCPGSPPTIDRGGESTAAKNSGAPHHSSARTPVTLACG